MKPPYQAARQYASHMSSSKKAETVTWWIVTANGADIAKIIAYRGLYTTGQKLIVHTASGVSGVPANERIAVRYETSLEKRD